MDQIRILLAGEHSGMRSIIENICANDSGMTFLYESDSKDIVDVDKFVTHSNVVKVVEKNDVNVVLLDLHDRDLNGQKSIPTMNLFSTHLAYKLIEKFPTLMVVSLLSKGRKMKVLTEFQLNDIGVNQLLNTIRSVVDRSFEK